MANQSGSGSGSGDCTTSRLIPSGGGGDDQQQQDESSLDSTSQLYSPLQEVMMNRQQIQQRNEAESAVLLGYSTRAGEMSAMVSALTRVVSGNERTNPDWAGGGGGGGGGSASGLWSSTVGHKRGREEEASASSSSLQSRVYRGSMASEFTADSSPAIGQFNSIIINHLLRSFFCSKQLPKKKNHDSGPRKK